MNHLSEPLAELYFAHLVAPQSYGTGDWCMVESIGMESCIVNGMMIFRDPANGAITEPMTMGRAGEFIAALQERRKQTNHVSP